MHKQAQALWEICSFLDHNHLHYMIIGGIANAAWGRPRETLDLDIKVLLEERAIVEVVVLVGSRFRFRVPDPVAFAERTYVLVIEASNQVPVDLVLGLLPYEHEAARRAVVLEYQGVPIRVCTAEDLIIHKAISERGRDWDDIEGVLDRQGARLDQAYILGWLEQFAQVLERPDLLARYRGLLATRKLPGGAVA